MMSQKAIVVMHNKASTSRLREIDCQWESRIALVIQNTRGPRNIIGDADYKNFVLHVLWSEAEPTKSDKNCYSKTAR